MSNPNPITRAWRIESRRKEVGYATRCFYCPEMDIFCFEMEHPVTKGLDEYFKRAVCRNCHRKLEFRRDIKELTHNGKHNVRETSSEKLKRYILLMAEDHDSVAEHLQRSPNFPIEVIVADYKARASSLRRIANALPLTVELGSPTIPKKRPNDPEPTPIFLRVHTRIKNEKRRGEYEGKLPDTWANFALVLDCETTTDIRQDLNFLWWRFCELKDDSYVCQQEGVVYADELNEPSVELIRSFVHGKQAQVEEGCPKEIRCESRTEFVDGEFWDALRLGACIVCYNSPFDLSRFALEYREAQIKNSGWSMVMWRHECDPALMPRLRIKPKDSRSAFINLAGGEAGSRVVYRGRFLDLSVFCWALRNKHLTLEQALRSFGLKGKLRHEPTGRITEKELRYGRRDVERTVALLNAMKREYDGFALDLPPEDAYSAASITKAFLEKMNIAQPSRKFNLSDEILGNCMQAYYGGRSEIRIRHQEVPVVVCDTTSEYPSVAGLLNLWPMMTAAELEVQEYSKKAREILAHANLRKVLNPAEWEKFAFFALTRPRGDVLPVRAIYSEDGSTNIGLNPLTSEKPIWYAGPDLVASRLLSPGMPQIIKAFRIVARGVQPDLETATIGARQINPEIDDFFRAVIEERKKLPKTHPHYLLLKIIANALYGIFAELNKYEYGKNRKKDLQIFSGEYMREEKTDVVERPGKFQFPPAAALITAGGRLMLAILEKLVEKKSGNYLLTDTDSMLFVASERGGLVPCPGGEHKMRDGSPGIKAISWKEVNEICSKVNRLNPYSREIIPDILKIEDSNFDRNGKQKQLYGLAVSAKRYVAYKRKKHNIEIIKPSEHGLGIVFVPDKRPRYKPVDCKDQEADYALWIVEAWERLLLNHFRNLENPQNVAILRPLRFDNLPAMMRVRVTTPNVLKALRKRDPGAAKPYNFAHSPILLEEVPECTLVAPASKRSREWLTRDYTEIHTGETVKLGSKYRDKTLTPQTISHTIWKHFLHKEDKSLGPDGTPCHEYTRGLLLRRPVNAMIPFEYIGKEVERRAQEGEDVAILENSGPIRYGSRRNAKTRPADLALIAKAGRYGLRELIRDSKTSQHAVERFLQGKRVYPGTRMKLEKAIQKLHTLASRS